MRTFDELTTLEKQIVCFVSRGKPMGGGPRREDILYAVGLSKKSTQAALVTLRNEGIVYLVRTGGSHNWYQTEMEVPSNVRFEGNEAVYD